MNLMLQFLLVIVLVESMTNLISKSLIFRPLRKSLFDHRHNTVLRFLHNLIDCPSCTSVWVSWFVLIIWYLYYTNLLPNILALFFMGLILHRLANVWHFIIDRIDQNYNLSLDEEYNNKESID